MQRLKLGLGPVLQPLGLGPRMQRRRKAGVAALPFPDLDAEPPPARIAAAASDSSHPLDQRAVRGPSIAAAFCTQVTLPGLGHREPLGHCAQVGKVVQA